MRTLAIDFGTRRIGLALSDAGGRYATPHEVLFVTDPLQAIAPILRLINHEQVQRIVVGYPLNMDGSPGGSGPQVVTWAEQLARQLSHPIPILFVEQRLSSFAAEQQLMLRKRSGEKLTRKRKKKSLDAIAAAGILQAFLDGKLDPIDVIPSPDKD